MEDKTNNDMNEEQFAAVHRKCLGWCIDHIELLEYDGYGMRSVNDRSARWSNLAYIAPAPGTKGADCDSDSECDGDMTCDWDMFYYRPTQTCDYWKRRSAKGSSARAGAARGPCEYDDPRCTRSMIDARSATKEACLDNCYDQIGTLSREDFKSCRDNCNKDRNARGSLLEKLEAKIEARAMRDEFKERFSMAGKPETSMADDENRMARHPDGRGKCCCWSDGCYTGWGDCNSKKGDSQYMEWSC